MSAPEVTRPRQLPRPLESWEHDNAHQALDQWVWAWRQKRMSAPLPAGDFAQHIGREAVELMASGMPKVEMARLFWACGDEGECPCGLPWDRPVPRPADESEAS